MLISFEGTDYAGKTTQAGLLAQRCLQEGIPVFLDREPTQGGWGKKARQLITTGGRYGEILHALHEDRREHYERIINPLTRMPGMVVILDRYYHSMVAYQGVGRYPDVLLEWQESYFPRPNMTFYLNVPMSIIEVRRYHRGASDTFEQDMAFLTKVKANYDAIHGPNWFPIPYVNKAFCHEQIWAMVERKFCLASPNTV